MGSSCSSQVSCSSSTTASPDHSAAPRGASHDHREQERIDSQMIAETDALLSDARRHRDRGDVATALELFVKALQARVEYLGLNDDSDDRAVHRTIRRLQRAAAAQAADSGSCSQNATPRDSAPLTPQFPQQHEAWASAHSGSGSPVEVGRRMAAARGGQDSCSDSDASNPTNGVQNRGAATTHTRRRATHRSGGAHSSNNNSHSHHSSSNRARAGDSMESSTTSTLGEHTTRTITKPRAYFHSHVSLLNEIGNLYLRIGNLHLGFFYFFESISILTPVLTASAQAGVKHSGLPSYVDAIIGVTLVYISLAESVVHCTNSNKQQQHRASTSAFDSGGGRLGDGSTPRTSQEDGGEASGDGAIRATTVNPSRSVVPPREEAIQTSPTMLQHSSKTATNANSAGDDMLAESIQFAFRAMMPFTTPTQYNTTEDASNKAEGDGGHGGGRPAPPATRPIVDADDLKMHGLDPSPAFRASVAALAKRLEGCHPLIVARDQLNEAMAVIQHTDNSRSVYLIPIMHMQCRIALMFDQKKLALHLMQKCLGLTYWYRNGASDAYALAIYSHKSLARIRLAIKRSDAATKIQRWYWRRVAPERCAAHYRAMHATVNPYTAVPAAPSTFTASQQLPGNQGPPQLSPTPQQQQPLAAATPASVRAAQGRQQPQQERSVERDDPLRASSRAQLLTLADDEIAVGNIVRTESGLGRKGGRVHAGADFFVAAGGAGTAIADKPMSHPSTTRTSLHTTTTASGGSAAPSYQLPELKPVDGDDALLTLVHGYDDGDDDDDRDAEANRSQRVHKAKDNVVDAITSLFQTMQRTMSAASFHSSGTPMGMLMGGSGSGEGRDNMMASSRRSSVAMSGAVLSVTSSDAVVSPNAESLQQQRDQDERQRQQSSDVTELLESPTTRQNARRVSTTSATYPTTQTSVTSSLGGGGYPPTLAQQISGQQSVPSTSGNISGCQPQRSSLSCGDNNTTSADNGTAAHEDVGTTASHQPLQTSNGVATGFGSFCSGAKTTAPSDVDLTPESNATGGMTRRVGSMASQAVSSTTSPGQRSDGGVEGLHDGSVHVPLSCDEQQEKEGAAERRLHEFDARSVDSEDEEHQTTSRQTAKAFAGSNQAVTV